AIQALARREQRRPLTVLDIATGDGDVPIALFHRAARAGVQLQIDACDISKHAIATAPPDAPVEFFSADVLSAAFPPPGRGPYDVVMCSLFLHHLPNDQIVRVLECM